MKLANSLKHACTYLKKIIAAGVPITNQHYILIFSLLKETDDEVFKSIIMRLYEGWRTGKGDGANISTMQLLAEVDSELKRLTVLGQWKTKAKTSELLGLQAKFDILQAQFTALLANQHKPPPTSSDSTRPTGQPRPEENETRVINGTTWYYCTNCFSVCCWNKTHKSDQHKRGIGKNKKNTGSEDKYKNVSNMAAYDLGYGSDFQQG